MSQTQSDDSPDDEEVYPFLIDAPDNRGQHDFCKNLLLNLFEPGISPCKADFPDVKIKRQIIEHYLKDICNLTQQYGIYTIEFSTPNPNHRKYVIQTDDLELEFSKVFLEYIKSIQYHNSQRANSIFTNKVFAIIFTYLSILEKTEFQSISPTETSKHTKVRHEITLFSTFLHIIKENFTKDDVSQHTKHDLQKILAWFIIDYFTHNIDLISQARKNFRPQNPNDDTAITEESDYVWDPEWSHHAFINIPQSISSQAISTISYQRDYVKVVPLTIDATPLNYNTFLPDTRNNSLNSTVIHNENLNGTRNLTQQDIQTPSHFINEEIVQTTTTTQQSISPIHPNLTTPKNLNTSLAQVTLQSTVKPSVAPKYSQMDYQTYRPMTVPSKPRRTFTRNTFAEHNYNFAHSSKTNYPPRKTNNNHVSSHYWDNPMTTTNSVNFRTNSHPPQDHSENYPFFQQNKNKKQTPHHTDYLSSDPIPNQTQEINNIPIINHELRHITEIEIIHIIEIEDIRTIEIRITRTIDQEIIHITDQTITDQITIIKTDHRIIHKIEIQVIIINIEIIPNHHIGIMTIIIILNIDTEVVHQNIKDILIKYSQMKKQHQTPQILMTQEITNYN